jgi:hypothetical protein
VLFSFGPCLLLRSGLVLLIEDLPSLETTEQMPPVN